MVQITMSLSPPSASTMSPSPPISTITSSRPFLPPLKHGKLRKCRFTIRASSSSFVLDGEAVAHLERCFVVSPPGVDVPSSSASWDSGPVMKGGKYGAFGAVTLEKSKLQLSQKLTKSSPELDVGGRGGDMGKGLNHGGGDGGDDGGDDDDYFDNFDEGDEGEDGGIFRRRIILPELFDRKFLEAVLNEWQKTVMDLPSGFRQAFEMGLVSSAQMMNFLAMNARPTTERFIARCLPQEMSRAFYGRMIADPAFMCKFLFEQLTTIGCSAWWEIKNRKQRIKQEWQLALVNVLTAAACNGTIFWLLAPCHSYGNTFRFDLQNTLQKLPNNIFEKSYPLREFDGQKRLQSFLYKAAELSMVGFVAGTIQNAISNLAASKVEGRLSVTIPSLSTSALGYGSSLLFGNLRYQLLCGFDRAVTNYFDVIGVSLFLSAAMRVANIQLGETARLAWVGVEVDPLAHSDELLQAAYSRPSESDHSSSKWFISKNAITSGLGLLGFKQQSSDGNSTDASSSAPPQKTRRKRIVRRKVASS